MPKSCGRWSFMPILALLLLPGLAPAQISVEISTNVSPPELPVYDQPPIPADGFVWTPGYWAWSDDSQDYFWVPGTWVQAPQPEYLWTPGFWALAGPVFLWHPGYWGTRVGFYGGINYGYGYGGGGYDGGYWQGGRFYYNRAVNNIQNVSITNVYNKTVVNTVVNRSSYNGGSGVQAQPTPRELTADRERRLEPTPMQRRHVELAGSEPALRASQNQGMPPIAATPRPAAFRDSGAVAARRGGTFSVIRPNNGNPGAGNPSGGNPPAALPRGAGVDRAPADEAPHAPPERRGLRERDSSQPPAPRNNPRPEQRIVQPPSESRPPSPVGRPAGESRTLERQPVQPAPRVEAPRRETPARSEPPGRIEPPPQGAPPARPVAGPRNERGPER